MAKNSKRIRKLRENQEEGHVVDYPVALLETTVPLWVQRKKLIDGFGRIRDALEQCNREIADELKGLLIAARLIENDTGIVFKVVGDKVRVFRKKHEKRIEGAELKEQDVAAAVGQQPVDSSPSIVSARDEAGATGQPSEAPEESAPSFKEKTKFATTGPLVRFATKR